MKICTGENGGIELRDVFNPLTLRIDDEKLNIAMRDRGFEFRYGGKVYFARGSVIHEAYPGGKNLAAEKPLELHLDPPTTVGDFSELAAMKRNIEIAANISLEDLEIRGRALYPWLQHRKDVAQRWLNTEANDAKQVDALHELFEYDQAQLRELLGLLEIGDMI